VIQAEDVTVTGIGATAGFSVVVNSGTPGTLYISTFSITGALSGSGEFLSIRFHVSGPLGSTSPLTFTDASINEGRIPHTFHHGLFTVGETVDAAAYWFITMERSCQAQLLAEAAGTPILIDDDAATLTASQVGSHVSGYVSFQPLYAKITREQPDLFD